MTRPIALWTTPRSISTAFDKMMRGRDDITVRTEPFSIAYYDGPEQRSHHYPVTEPDLTFDRVLENLLAGPRPLFVKDMAYQLGPLLRADVLARFHNTFLIRDPRRSLPSLFRKGPHTTDEEIGYRALRRAFDLVVGITDSIPPVIDATDLRSDPDGIVAAWCGAVGLPHRPSTLTWEPGMPDEWQRWADWFERAAASTRFTPPDADPPEVTDPEVLDRIDAARPDYLALFRHRLGPGPDAG